METNRHSICSRYSGVPLISVYTSFHRAMHRSYIPHFHTSFEIALFKQGSGVYRCGGRFLSFRAGDIFVFSTNEEHFIEQISEDMSVLNVHFEFQYILSCAQTDQQSSLMDVFFNRRSDFSNKIEGDRQIARDVRELMLSLEREIGEKKANFEIIVQAKLLNILGILSREYGNSEESYKIPSHLDKMRELEAVIDHINAHYTEPLTLDELSQVGKMDVSSLCKLFKRTHGITIWDYITIRRIDKAKELLRAGEEKIIDIQYLCGYNTYANFNKSFKKLTGVIPKEYREAYRKIN